MGQVIAVMSATGGVGGTTLAAALAVRAAAAGRSSAAIDAEPWGGGLDVIFGAEQEPGWRWTDLQSVEGVVDGAALRRRLPEAESVALLAHPRSGAEGEWLPHLSAVTSALRATSELTVISADRDDRLVDRLSGLVDIVLLVSGEGMSQLAGCSGAVARLRRRGLEPWVVGRTERGSAELIQLVCDELQVPLVATLGQDRRVASDALDGIAPGLRGRGPLVEVADELVHRVLTFRDWPSLRRSA